MYAEQFWIIALVIVFLTFLIAGFSYKWNRYDSDSIGGITFVSVVLSIMTVIPLGYVKKYQFYEKSQAVTVQVNRELGLKYIEAFDNILIIDDLRFYWVDSIGRWYFEEFDKKKIDILLKASNTYPFCEGDTLFVYFGGYENVLGLPYKRKRLFISDNRDTNLDRLIMMSGSLNEVHEQTK